MISKAKRIFIGFALLGFLGFVYLKTFFYFFYFYYVVAALQVFTLLKKAYKSSFAYSRSMFLCFFNPFFLHQQLKQVGGLLSLLIKREKKANDRLEGKYSLPFKGEWKVFSGGITKETSHSWNIITQRYAYDFAKEENTGGAFRDDGKVLENYYCFGEEIISPEKGVVVEVRNEIRDYRQVGDLSFDWKTKDIRGNFIIISHFKEEYSFIGHLKKGSIIVNKGDFVEKGQKIGCCGNSGHSTMPHIHFHLQDSASFWTARGLPISFEQIEFKEEKYPTEQNIFISKGDIVNNKGI